MKSQRDMDSVRIRCHGESILLDDASRPHGKGTYALIYSENMCAEPCLSHVYLLEIIVPSSKLSKPILIGLRLSRGGLSKKRLTIINLILRVSRGPHYCEPIRFSSKCFALSSWWYNQTEARRFVSVCGFFCWLGRAIRDVSRPMCTIFFHRQTIVIFGSDADLMGDGDGGW